MNPVFLPFGQSEVKKGDETLEPDEGGGATATSGPIGHLKVYAIEGNHRITLGSSGTRGTIGISESYENQEKKIRDEKRKGKSGPTASSDCRSADSPRPVNHPRARLPIPSLSASHNFL